MALVQFALWSTQSLSLISQNKKQFRLSQDLLRRQIEIASVPQSDSENELGQWRGFRRFRISQRVKETNRCTSVYLTPEDGKPIVGFLPGQHLTFKFSIPGEAKPVVRCYSLSDSPNQDYYRISVKAVPAPPARPELAPGRVSNFINDQLMVGDLIDVKAPSGHFVLDEKSTAPIVLLGGGIGITPMISIVNHLVATQSNRLILLMYGIRNSDDHAFKHHLETLAHSHRNFHLINCYSQPLARDVEGKDYHVAGFASAALLQQVLPNKKCQFYLCGSPPFMEAIYTGLMDWGVPESRVLFEAFGPATIGKPKKMSENKLGQANAAQATRATVRFAKSDATASWDAECEFLLELAEVNNVEIDSGCRAGSCGTCETRLLKGKVRYPDNQSVDCPAGKCLACIAQPDGPIELDA